MPQEQRSTTSAGDSSPPPQQQLQQQEETAAGAPQAPPASEAAKDAAAAGKEAGSDAAQAANAQETAPLRSPQARPGAQSLDDATATEATAAMERAVAADPQSASTEKPEKLQPPGASPAAGQRSDVVAPKPIRGPRVIEGGREHRRGLVVSVGPEDVFIEFGPKELGVAQRSQWKDDELPRPGEEIEVVVERFNPNEMLYICLKPGAVQRAEWELLQKGQVIEAVVTGVNKGGLELEVAHHRAFMPASQVDIRPVADLQGFVGQKLTCVVRKVERAGRGNIVLSRRDLLLSQRKEQREKLKETLKVGQTLEGEVVSVQPYGAFVDIGGVEGLVHVSDMSHQRNAKPAEIVQPGQKVTVQILKLDWDNDRISLGMKQVAPDPFEQALETLKEGEAVSGRVVRTTEFGAFVELAPGVEGLVHISELSWKRVPTVQSVLKEGQVAQVKILSIDREKKRISLSVKQLTEPPKSARDDARRSAEEIRKETRAYRKLREEGKRKQKEGLKGGFGVDMGMGLGDLKL